MSSHEERPRRFAVLAMCSWRSTCTADYESSKLFLRKRSTGGPHRTFDWDELFTAAGIDRSRFLAYAQPQWIPPTSPSIRGLHGRAPGACAVGAGPSRGGSVAGPSGVLPHDDRQSLHFAWTGPLPCDLCVCAPWLVGGRRGARRVAELRRGSQRLVGGIEVRGGDFRLFSPELGADGAPRTGLPILPGCLSGHQRGTRRWRARWAAVHGGRALCSASLASKPDFVDSRPLRTDSRPAGGQRCAGRGRLRIGLALWLTLKMTVLLRQGYVTALDWRMLHGPGWIVMSVMWNLVWFCRDEGAGGPGPCSSSRASPSGATGWPSSSSRWWQAW